MAHPDQEMKGERYRLYGMLLLVCGVTMVLPQVPYYQDWMPYGYDLGGTALVVLYLAFGFFSLGAYGLSIGGRRFEMPLGKNPRPIRIGLVATAVGLGLLWSYGKLMDLNMSL